MKAREAHGLSTDELDDRLREAYQELFNLRFQKANREVTNHARIGFVKKDIARFKTIRTKADAAVYLNEVRAKTRVVKAAARSTHKP